MTTNPTAAAQPWFDLSKAPAKVGGGATTAGSPNLQADPTATKQMFLQLLVAQLKNQNPLNPADGTEFLAQLSQLTGVEQMVSMNQELAAIRKALTPEAAPQTPPAGN